MKTKLHDTEVFCVRTLSLAALCLIRVRFTLPRMVVYYDVLPRYLRGLCRFVLFREAVIVNGLEVIFGAKLNKIKHGEHLLGYANIHLEAMQAAARLAEKQIEKLRGDDWVGLFAENVGIDPALSFFVKQIAHLYMFPQALTLLACKGNLERNETRIWFVYDIALPIGSYEHFVSEFDCIDLALVPWPIWAQKAKSMFRWIYTSVAFPVLLSLWVIRRGVVIRKVPSKITGMTEFIDPDRLGGTPYDADYFFGNASAHEMLLFLTHMQERFLRRRGYDRNDLRNKAISYGHQFAVVDDLPYTRAVLLRQLLVYFRCLRAFKGTVHCAGPTIFLIGWNDFMDFLPIFVHYEAKFCVYLTFPNGQSSFRMNDGVITGLCRSHKVWSVGCQTRAIYSTIYECCFDCYDLYLVWGNAWHNAFPERMQFILERETIGCIYLDAQLKSSESTNRPQSNTEGFATTVSIFPSDMSPRHHYTVDYTLRFMLACATLAVHHPAVRFVVKMKDPSQIDEVMKYGEFVRVCEKVKNNFEILSRERYRYRDVLDESDIVIAIGFTTPGAEALLMGKRALYYSELSCGGQAFRHIPDFVAHDPDELLGLFQKAMSDHDSYSRTHRIAIAQLDPFCDGHAIDRIAEKLRILMEADGVR